MKLAPILTYVDVLKNVLEDDKTPLDDGDRKFVESLLEVEISIMDKDAFTSTEESTEKIRKLFSSSSDEFAETQRKGQERHRQVNKYQLKEQGELRTQAHELAFPETTPTKIHKRLIAIIQHQADYQLKKIKEKKAEIQRLRDEIERIDGEQKKVLQVALEKANQEMMDIMNQIGQTSYVSNLVKQIERAMKPFKIKTSQKAGKTYLSKDDERLLMDLQPYYSRDIDDKSDLWYDGITHEDFFKKLAKRYGKSLSGIKKFAQRHDPSKK